MINEEEIYSTEKGKLDTEIVFTKRANAPERGEIFTAQAIQREGKNDLVIESRKYHIGYIKKNLHDPVQVQAGKYYRFKIVSGPYQKRRHNYYDAIPLRKISFEENRYLNKLDPQSGIFIQRLAEFLLGFGWDRRTKKLFKLDERQRNWNWFYRTFRIKDHLR